MKVVVIESDPTLQEVLQHILEGAGYTAVSEWLPNLFHDPEATRLFIENERPDVILCDRSPPYKESYKFIDFLYELKRKECTLIVTGTCALPPDKRSIKILKKPFHLDELLGLLKDIEKWI